MTWIFDHAAQLLAATLIISAFIGFIIASIGIATSNTNMVSYGAALGMFSMNGAWMLWIGYKLGKRTRHGSTAERVRQLSEDMADVKMLLMEADETVTHISRR